MPKLEQVGYTHALAVARAGKKGRKLSACPYRRGSTKYYLWRTAHLNLQLSALRVILLLMKLGYPILPPKRS